MFESGEKQVFKDPICRRELDEDEIAQTSEYQGTTYRFCSLSCRAAFERQPEKFHKNKKEAIRGG